MGYYALRALFNITLAKGERLAETQARQLLGRRAEVLMLTKPFDDIGASDIEDLCKRGVYESQTLEFKQNLQGDGGRLDGWNAGGGISLAGRDGLLREIVAFANAQGGSLVLGIKETKDKPPRAEVITPMSRVHDLADRLQEAARACIEPPLAGLQVRGIAIQGRTEGVVILRTPGSLSGPHRLAGDGHAFIRRGPSSVKMSMREIQDLTLDLARGAERLESIFTDRATKFAEWLRNSSSTEEAAFRITGMPLGSFPGVPRISADPGDFPFQTETRQRVLLDGKLKTFSTPVIGGMRPIVRGIRMHAQDDSTRIDIYQTGVVDIWSRHSETSDGKHFYIDRVLASYLRILDCIDLIRSAANAPEFEFVLEFSLAGRKVVPGLGPFPLNPLVIGAPNNPHSTWRVTGLPVTFPRIPYRNRTNRVDVVRLAFSDLFDATGEPPPWSKLELPE